MKRMYKSLIAIIALIFFIAISTLFLNKVINPVNKNNYKAESKKEIVFEPYFLDENKIKILVIAQDDENLLSTLEQINREGKVLNKINIVSVVAAEARFYIGAFALTQQVS